ncbi:MAG: hypothetical protein JNL01_11375 [Bdellovibrionales bacterium]|nr:hypothetical protein [Bdellovibrionales bacterium]
MVRSFLILIFGILIAAPASAQQAKKVAWFHPHLLAGYGSSVSTADTSQTSVGATNIGTTLGIRIKSKFLVGMSVDYRFVTQFSDYDPTVGNRRGGSLTYVSPLLGFEYKMISVKGILHILGSYTMQNTTATGQKLSYQKASGFRAEMMIGWKFKFKPVLYYESVKFSNQALDGTPTSTQIPVVLTNYGLGLTYPF